MFLGISLTEATGVTRVVPMVMRIVTGEGTLIVEVSDPSAKVTVEGDGGLVISGAGLPEFRLPPGSYRVRAERDGRPIPLDREWVRITRDGSEVVKVRFESQGAARVEAGVWESLFNGRNLSGWKMHPKQLGNWRVEDGLLVGDAAAESHLFSERDDYQDFHLRAEVKINQIGKGGIFFRSEYGLNNGKFARGLQASIYNGPQQRGSRQRETETTGSLYWRTGYAGVLIPAEDWFTLEILARGPRVTIKINGLTTTEATLKADDDPPPGGHIALMHRADTVIRFRKIEIQRLTSHSVPAATAKGAPPERQAFVTCGLVGIAERKFDTLAEAVNGSSDGDTIEIRGNGPFDTEAVQVKGHRLVIRAGEGYRPVVRLRPPDGEVPVALLSTDAALRLEGLEFHVAKPADHPWLPRGVLAVLSESGPLRIANCTFLNKQETHGSGILQMRCSPHCELRNCLVVGDRGRLCDWLFPEGKAELIMVNCLQAGSGAICLDNFSHDPHEVSVVLCRNTRVTNAGLFNLNLKRPLDPPDGATAAQLVRLEMAENIFDSSWSMLQIAQDQQFNGDRQALSASAVEALLPRVISWQGRRNLYYSRGDLGYLTLSVDYEPLPVTRQIATLKELTELLKGGEVDSQEGQVRYQGGALIQRKRSVPEQITPEDLRLRPDSAGYRAGSDGNDLGAEIDLVGPGAAYDRWRKTPEYQQWLKETEQVK
jgi:hypothetical protein